MDLRSFSGANIIVVPDGLRQNRTHKRKRINKKWARDMAFLGTTHWRMGK